MLYCSHCSQLLTILNNIGKPESGVTTLNIIVDYIEQCGQYNMIQSSFQQYCNKLMIFRHVYKAIDVQHIINKEARRQAHFTS